ncbi:MAG: CBS domain-containing protein [Cyanobacteria bacterium J06632_22]
MDPSDLQSVTPSVNDAVDPDVLSVSADASIADVIAAMSGQAGEARRRRTSYALVLSQCYPIGILTERDIVRLTATCANISDLSVQRVMTSPVHVLKQSALQDIFAVLFLFRRYRIRHLPIVNDADELVGMVTPESIRRVLRPANLLKLRRVADVMSQDVIHAQRATPVLTLAQEMTVNRVSCIVIADTESALGLEAITPVGIVTERDIVQLRSMQLDLTSLLAQDVMSTPLFLLSPQDSLWDAHREMQHRRVRRLVVSWNWGKGLGIVTQTSLLKIFDPIEMYGIIESMQQTIHQLKDAPSVRAPSPPPAKLAELLLDLEASLLQLSTVPAASSQTVDHALLTLQQVREQLQVQQLI